MVWGERCVLGVRGAWFGMPSEGWLVWGAWHRLPGQGCLVWGAWWRMPRIWVPGMECLL